MATILLQAAGAALGGFFGPVGAIVGRAAGALLGGAIDQSIVNSMTTISGAQLSSARIAGADEGTAIPRVYGTMRIGATLFWATRFEEEATTEGSGGKATGPRVETYKYFGNFALALCEGRIAAVRRVWADGQELDLADIEMRVHHGSMTQGADPLLEAKQGEGNTPAYRGLAYVVFERLPLDTFGNRIPVFQFEVVRPIGALEKTVKAVTLIPGATEHGYDPDQVTETVSDGEERIINRNVTYATSDWEASLDELQAVAPNLESVALVTSWFGTDLRAGNCAVLPGVEVRSRTDESKAWRVSGVTRASAHLISKNDGGPAYGGTPNDAAVVAAIKDLKKRGLKVFLYPFLLMDVPSGNGLADPYGGAEQAAYPWRGRITCHPAAGVSGSADQTSTARNQIEAFVGSANAGDFTVSGEVVTYNGSEESFRRMVLHYALLAEAAGGVDGFIIGSEMRGLTQVRDAGNDFPFVDALVDLAADVRAIVGSSTKITYGADWSEYFGYHPSDGAGDVFFNLDPLWASDDIDAVGIDNYMPLTDWRDDDLTAANPDGMTCADDQSAMMAAITSGEGFDWYYASDSDRDARTRSEITDGLANKPWVFRYKDIESWWSNYHHNRINGAEASGHTGWTPGAKPIWFTELGCPAVERGANQPNVFIDPKSSESMYPYFSGGARSDSQQRRFLEAHLKWWSSANAPGGMVDADRIFLWTWDARPAPAFPENTELFADGENWQTGHWLNGRMGAGTQAEVIAAIMEDHGFHDYAVSEVSGDLTGYVQGDVTSARQMLEPLMQAFQIGARESGGILEFFSRASRSAPTNAVTVVVDEEGEPLWDEKRGQEADFASEALLDHYDEAGGYERASARSRKMSAGNERVLRTSLNGVLPEATATGAVEEMLRDHRVQRRTLHFRLPPLDIAFEPGDMVALDGVEGDFLISRMQTGASRAVEASEYVPPMARQLEATTSRKAIDNHASASFAPIVALLDLPRLGDGGAMEYAMGAAFAKPWSMVTLLSSAETEGYTSRCHFEKPATMGELTADLTSGTGSRFDYSQSVTVKLIFGSFSSASKLQVLNGANRIAVLSNSGAWEIISFLDAEALGEGLWNISGLLRGQFGTEDAMVAGASAGARVVLLNDAVKSLALGTSELGLVLNWRAESGAKGVQLSAFAGGERASTPLAPVHLTGARGGGGDIQLTWVRRGRDNANSWSAYEIAMDEPEERYLVEILSGGTVLRSEELTSPTYTYAQSDELADFGAQQSELAFRVRQIGWTVALGIAATATISV